MPHLGAAEGWAFEKDKHTPTNTMCKVYNAWTHLLAAASKIAIAEP